MLVGGVDDAFLPCLLRDLLGVMLSKLAFAFGSAGIIGLPFASRSTTVQAVSNRAAHPTNAAPHCFNDITSPPYLLRLNMFSLLALLSSISMQSIKLFLFFLGFAVFQEVIGLFDCHLRLLPAWLQNGGFDVAFVDDGVTHVVAAVKADHNHVVFPAAFSAASAPSAMVSLPEITRCPGWFADSFHTGEGFGLAPVRGLLRHHFHIRKIIQHIVVALRADAGVGVRLTP
jgi:hypothetical protein